MELEEKPFTVVSVSLKQTLKQYAQIEKDPLALLYDLEYFNEEIEMLLKYS